MASSAGPLVSHRPLPLPAAFPLKVPNVLFAFSFFALMRSEAITTHDDLFQTTSSREAELCSFPLFPRVLKASIAHPMSLVLLGKLKINSDQCEAWAGACQLGSALLDADLLVLHLSWLLDPEFKLVLGHSGRRRVQKTKQRRCPIVTFACVSSWKRDQSFIVVSGA